MNKGILILFGTFLVIGIVHFVSMKLINIPESKKATFRKLFWYFYGILWLLLGTIKSISHDDFHWTFLIEPVLGLVIIVLNLLGKIENKKA